MFLTEDDIRNLTGYKLGKCQMKWLRENGIKFLVGYDGKPRVMTKHLEVVMGIKQSSDRRTQPDEKALLARMGIN